MGSRSDLPYHYQSGNLYCESVALEEIAAAVGTPVYVYSRTDLINRARTSVQAAPESALVCFAVKANGNPALLRLLADEGLGADVTSGGELFLAFHAGVPADRIIFSGVGKTRQEIEYALGAGIRALHVESAMELDEIAAVATRLNCIATIGLRVNPDIDADTHPYISTGRQAHKFGVPASDLLRLARQAAEHPNLHLVGLAAHVGSQIRDSKTFSVAANKLVELAQFLGDAGIALNYLDAGGGLGLDYYDYAQNRAGELKAWVETVAAPISSAGYRLVLEPGRAIVAPSGALLTSVLYTKDQGGSRFAIVDAGMNDLLRPALYQAHHPILPVRQSEEGKERTTNVVGPVCESGDYLALDRQLPPMDQGDLLAVLLAGAYGFAMSSNYNGRVRPAEVLVDGDEFHIIRRRQGYEALQDGCN